MIHEGQKSFRSQVAYVSLVAVLIITALIVVVWDSPAAALVFAAAGVVWTGFTLRSGINVTAEGFTVRGMFRTERLSWADTDAFIVMRAAGSRRPLLRTGIDYIAANPAGPQVVGLSLDAINDEAVATRVPVFSVVAAVTTGGEWIRVHGTASTPLDPDFPTEAAAALNRMLAQHNPGATALTVAAAAPA